MAATGFAFLVDGSEGLAGVKSVVGGNVRGQVRRDASVPGLRPRKRVETLTYEPFAVQVGLDGTGGLLKWLSDSLEHGSVLKGGEVHTTDDEYRSLTVRQFFSGVIREAEIPACDANSEEVNHISLKIEPQGLRLQVGRREKLEVAEEKKPWIAANFRVGVDGLPSQRVLKVDPLVWKQSSPVQSRSVAPEIDSPGNAVVDVPNVRMTISMSDVDPWLNWVNEFLMSGNVGVPQERTGQIDLLAPDQQEVLAQVDLLGLGPVSLDVGELSASPEAQYKFTVEMYCQDMRFQSFV